MTRSDILAAALLDPVHPRYGLLSYGRFERIKALTDKSPPDDSRLHTGIAWYVCTRPETDHALLSVLAMDDPTPVLRDIFEQCMPASEFLPFVEWFNGQMQATEAASTKPKESGKSDAAQLAATPTT